MTAWGDTCLSLDRKLDKLLLNGYEKWIKKKRRRKRKKTEKNCVNIRNKYVFIIKCTLKQISVESGK